MKTFAVKVARRLWYFIATLIVLAALTVSASRLLTPLLNSHRADFERYAAQRLHMPVVIKHIHISWNIFVPQLTFEQVAILDDQAHQPVLQARAIHVKLSLLRSLFHWQFLLDRLKVIGVHLFLHQQSADRASIEGLGEFDMKENIGDMTAKTNGLTAWIFSQPDLVLDDINVHYFSLQGAEKIFTLNRLSLSNNANDHVLTGQVVLHQAVTTMATLGLKWQGNIMDLAHVSAQAYFYLEAISLPQWLSQMTWNHLHIKEGLGSAKIWLNWEHGQWQMIQSKFQIYELQLQSDITQKLQVISRLSGRVGWKRQGETQLFTGEDILIDFPEHLWPTTHFTLTLQKTNEQLALQSLHIGYLDLGEVKDVMLMSGLLPRSIQKELMALDLQGNTLGLTLNLHHPELFSFDSSHLNGGFFSSDLLNNLSFFSGFSGLSFKNNGALPGIQHLNGLFSWDGKEGTAKLDSKHLTVTMNTLFLTPLKFEQLNGTFKLQKNAAQSWVVTAKNLQIKNADAEAQIDGALTLPMNDAPVIDLTGSFSVANGPKLIDYLPLKIWDPDLIKWLKNAIKTGKVTSGKIILQGKLSDYPFDQDTGKFLISGVLKDVDLNYASGWPLLQHINGMITFANSSMIVAVDSAQILNTKLTDFHAVIPYLGKDAPQILSVGVDVTTDFADTLQFIHTSPLEKTLGKELEKMVITGPMQLKIGLSVPLGKPTDASIDSSVIMQDANLSLPSWKLALEKLHGTFHFTEESMTASHIQGRLWSEPVDLNIATDHPVGKPTVVKVNLQSKLSIPVLQSWLNLPLNNVLQGEANVDAELDLASHLQTDTTQIILRSDLVGMSVALPFPYGKKAEEKKNVQLNFSAAQGRIVSAQLKLWQILDAIIHYQPMNQQFVIDMNGTQMLGKLSFSLAHSPFTLMGRFKRFVISSLTDNTRQHAIRPASLPALDIVIDNVLYGAKNLGRVVLSTVPFKNGMQIKQLQVQSALMNLNASGNWALQNNYSVTHIQGDFKTPNVSRFLNSWDMKSNNLVGSGGTVSFDLNWADAPYNPSINSINGTVSLKLTEGRIVDLGSSTDTKIGFGRMLNLFSLQTIPRRLSFDFTDLFEKGYSFDSMKGDFKLEKGNAYTQNARFNGPIARVDIAGRVGLANKDYDITLGVTPYVTSSLPVVAAIAGGPLALVATWVVDKVVSRAVSNVVTYHYKVTGQWDAPVWKQISRKAAKEALHG